MILKYTPPGSDLEFKVEQTSDGGYLAQCDERALTILSPDFLSLQAAIEGALRAVEGE